MLVEGQIEETVNRLYESIGRLPYLCAVCVLLPIEYAAAMFPRVMTEYNIHSLSPALSCLISAIVFTCTATLGWLSARRAFTVNAHGLTALLAVVPWFQLLAIPILAFARERDTVPPRISLLVMRGALWGLGVALAGEIILTLAFGQFGIALFVGSPFLVGLITSYFVERDGAMRPYGATLKALTLASVVLFGFAFEGLFCLILAFPLAIVASLIGGWFGIRLARFRTSRNTALSSIALLPLLIALETAHPPLAEFADVRSIEVDAPPAAVWLSIIDMGEIREAPAAPFGWGLAYPLAGHIDGNGVGAVRRGVFSTGVAYERVTRWEVGQELWFDVLSDPPMMRETNPFGPVHSAHLVGYFATRTARFTIAPLANGRTRLTLATDHALMIGPTIYFEPISRWAVAENKRRVLDHFRDHAESIAVQSR
jgi:hypothetical protein